MVAQQQLEHAKTQTKITIVTMVATSLMANTQTPIRITYVTMVAKKQLEHAKTQTKTTIVTMVATRLMANTQTRIKTTIVTMAAKKHLEHAKTQTQTTIVTMVVTSLMAHTQTPTQIQTTYVITAVVKFLKNAPKATGLLTQMQHAQQKVANTKNVLYVAKSQLKKISKRVLTALHQQVVKIAVQSLFTSKTTGCGLMFVHMFGMKMVLTTNGQVKQLILLEKIQLAQQNTMFIQ